MSACRGSRDRGVAMLVVLVFTLALTGIAIVSARLALMGESVARNQLDLQVARQAAEAALRDAEKDLMIANGKADFPGLVCQRGDDRPVLDKVALFTEGCLRGQCLINQGQRQQVDYTKGKGNQKLADVWWPQDKGGRWGDAGEKLPTAGGIDCAAFTGAVPLGVFTGAKAIQGVAFQPEYLIENVRRGDDTFFRITARGFGYRANTEVVLQSYFMVPQM